LFSQTIDIHYSWASTGCKKDLDPTMGSYLTLRFIMAVM